MLWFWIWVVLRGIPLRYRIANFHERLNEHQTSISYCWSRYTQRRGFCLSDPCAPLGQVKLKSINVHLVPPRPLGTPLPIPLPALGTPEPPPLILVLRAMPELAVPLVVAPPLPGAIVCREPLAEGGPEYLLAGLLLVGGFSTNDVSVVKKVASSAAGMRSRNGESCRLEGASLWRAKDWGIGALKSIY